MKKGLTWNNLSEMLTYDTGIAFHDVNTTMVNQKDSILKHFTLSQQIILNKLQGRGCKMLAEPNGNETYTTAALNYSPIRLMTAERSSSAGTQVVKLFPFKIDSNLSKHVILRTFYNSPYDIVSYIERQMKFDKEEREAVHVGVHATDATFAQFLLWLNNKYGKDGDDTVWFPSMEEFYEYNYYRVQGNITRQVEKNKIKLTISLPSENYFYYPSVTINLSGIKKEQIKLITIDDKVKGFSFANYGEGIMLNIDYRRYLTELAIHFVEKYEDFRSVSNRNDALYFVKKLKDSTAKDELLT